MQGLTLIDQVNALLRQLLWLVMQASSLPSSRSKKGKMLAKQPSKEPKTFFKTHKYPLAGPLPVQNHPPAA
jgi:hypothetical protein